MNLLKTGKVIKSFGKGEKGKWKDGQNYFIHEVQRGKKTRSFNGGSF